MYRISPFTPLFFNKDTDRTSSPSRYMQVFSPSDQILIQVITQYESRAITGKIVNVCTQDETEIYWTVWSLNSHDNLYYHVLTALPDGYYYVEINGIESEVFHVTSDESKLLDTTLIQYSMRDNKSRQDGVFWVSGVQQFFDWRVPGGFMDDDWSFGVSNEQFTDSDYNVSEIYSREVTYKSFTLGNAIGCPIWYADLLNRIMSCTYVYFNGERYLRMESSVPEITKVIESKRSYVFKQALVSVDIVDASESDNLLKIRRVDESIFRKTTNRLLTI